MAFNEKFYLEVQIDSPPEIAELVNLSLFELGAQGLVEQPGGVTAFFPDCSEQELTVNILSAVRQAGAAAGMAVSPNVSVRRCAERDWNAEWKRGWEPLRISDGIMIKPSWLDLPSDAPPLVIEIDPEMAFGSGDHPTTKLVLQLLEKDVCAGDCVLDVGTGTGILAIAALKLGAGQAVAFDVDPQAAQTAKKNAALNGVAERMTVFTGDIQAVRQEAFDLIVANVNRTQIVRLLEAMSRKLRLQGFCLLSGILTSEEELIRRACAHSGLTVLQVLSEKEWLAFEVRKG